MAAQILVVDEDEVAPLTSGVSLGVADPCQPTVESLLHHARRRVFAASGTTTPGPEGSGTIAGCRWGRCRRADRLR